MPQHSLSRTELLIGKEGLDKLKNAKVVVYDEWIERLN